MNTAAPPANLSTTLKPWRRWTGRVLSLIPVLMLAFSAGLKLAHPPEVLEGTAKLGWEANKLLLLAALELGSAVIYVIPRTAVLGAILVTGYLGGAVATHVRIGDPGWPTALVLGVLVWAGLYLRDERLHSLVPLRKP